ncbi:MAG: DUF3488 and transglutaminase-like domain-containing protein [Nitrospiraceae bacterium]
MSLERAFQFSTRLLVSLAFLGLAVTAPLALGFRALGSLACVVSLYELWRNRPQTGLHTLSIRFWNAAILVAFAWFWVDFLWLTGDLLNAGVHFLIALMVTKLFNLHQRRDYLQLYAISLMMVLASAGMTTDLWYGAVVIAYLITGVWTLLLYQLRMELVAPRGLPHPPTTESATTDASAHVHQPSAATTIPPLDAGFFWTTNAVACVSLLMALAIFFSIPRFGTGYFNKGRGDGLRTAGFSEQVDLGAIGSIKLDDTIVMRVELPGTHNKPNEPLYLRGMAYDSYNGRSWLNTAHRRRMPQDNATHLYQLPRQRLLGAEQSDKPDLVQDILLESLDTTVLFGASTPRAIGGDVHHLQTDAMGGIYLPQPPQARTQYRVWSRTTRWPEETPSSSSSVTAYPPEISRHFLHVADASPELLAFAQQITHDATTPQHKVLAVHRTLQTGYRYSLDVGRTLSDQPLDDFLFRRKTGYCEHYATAMVVLLRSVGVPARLVTGFLPSEWNDYGGYYTVRQRDAHAWVEVYDPTVGWVTVDPTPSEPAAQSPRWWQRGASLWDTVRLQWERIIVHYSASDQAAALHSVRDTTAGLHASLTSAWQAMTRPFTRLTETAKQLVPGAPLVGQALVWLITLLGGVALWIVAQRWYRNQAKTDDTTRASTQTPASAAVREAQQLYRQIDRVLAEKGFTKAPSATPQEFFDSVGASWREAAQTLAALSQAYYVRRFGAPSNAANGSGDTPAQHTNADHLLTTLRALPAPTDQLRSA